MCHEKHLVCSYCKPQPDSGLTETFPAAQSRTQRELKLPEEPLGAWRVVREVLWGSAGQLPLLAKHSLCSLSLPTRCPALSPGPSSR